MKPISEIAATLRDRIKVLYNAQAVAEKEWMEWSGITNGGGTPFHCQKHPQVKMETNVALSVAAWRQGIKTIIRDPCSECRLEEYLGKCGVPPILVGKRFENFVPQTEQDGKQVLQVKQFARRLYLDPTLGGFCILTSPMFGNGKSHLGVAIMATARLSPMLWVAGAEFMRWVSLRYEHRTERDIVRECCKTGLLVFDDLGASAERKDQQPKLHEVFDYRYRESLATVITTNVSDEAEFERLVGQRIADRLRESAVVYVRLTSESMRKEARKIYIGGWDE